MTKMCLCALLLIGMVQARAQTSNVPRSTNSTMPTDNPFGVPRGSERPDDDATNAYFRRRMEEARKLDRKKRMVDTAKRLLVLTQQLQHDLQGREATPEDQKRLDEIARLARTVKDQMRQ